VVPRTVHLWQYPHTVLSPPALLCSVSPEDLEPLEQGMSEVGKPKPNSCLFFFYLLTFQTKPIILPRQARDKNNENSTAKAVLLCDC
jgi:hypothetical protein